MTPEEACTRIYIWFELGRSSRPQRQYHLQEIAFLGPQIEVDSHRILLVRVRRRAAVWWRPGKREGGEQIEEWPAVLRSWLEYGY